MKSSIYFLLLIIIVSASCKKILELEPKQSVEATEALKTTRGVESALNAVYARLRDIGQYGCGLIAIPEALSDNAIHTGTNSQYRNTALNQPLAHFDNYESGFYGINEANLVLDALNNIEAAGNWKDAIAGQAHFLRALFYHNLAKAYGYDPTAVIAANDRGTIPIVTKGVLSFDQIEDNPRSSIADIYQFIYKDLDSAFTQLTRSNTPPAGSYRATTAAVLAIWSRVALFNGDYEKVVSAATDALELGVGTFQSKENYVKAWRSESHPESVFEVPFKANENIGANNSLRAIFSTHIDAQNTAATTHGVLVVSDELNNLYTASDVRKQLIWKGLGTNASRNEISKFISRGGIKDLDNVPVIRVSELYLNRAEAYMHIDREDLALIDLNKIRERAGLTAVNFTGNTLLDEIWLQRRLELAFEGHRFCDLKRLGKNIVKPSGNVPFSDYRILAPIPYREVNASDVLRQNRGY